MSNLKLNETPVRTSKSFRINNIKIEDLDIPEHLEEFKNVTVSEMGSKITISSEVNKADLKYGLGDIFTNQVNEESNYKANIVVDCKTHKEVEIDFELDKTNPNLAETIKITSNEDTKSTIILKYETIEDVKAYHNAIIRAKAKKNATLNIIIVNLMNELSNNFMAIQNEFEEDSRINYCIIDFGGKNSVTNYYSNISGDRADNRLNTIYIGKNEQRFDLNYIAELYGKKSNIDIEVQGALKGNSKKNFKGTIDFKKGCKKATGNENENCMLLSDKAKSIALPMLLCSEEEVEGNHSSSAGKIGEKELFYIMSRGFELKEAMKLLVRAKFNKILENVKNEELKETILEEIDKRLD
ncbi:MAG: SufD family Fe-S cluster assembly protein [Clostridia bacterium]|nr:SufD family Fe-S cluster assembly protein [Clostridia bacterium]